MQRNNNKRSKKQNSHPESLYGLKRLTKSPHLSHKLSKSMAIVGIIFVVIMLFGIGGYFYITSKTSNKNNDNYKNNINDALNEVGVSSGVSNISKSAKIESSLGFSLKFDPSTTNVQAQVTDPSSTAKYITWDEYEGDDALEKRPYSLVKLRLKKRTTELAFAQPEVVILTNIRKSYWDSALPGEQKIDTLIRKNSEGKTSYIGYAASKPEDISINGNNYKKITYTNLVKYDQATVTKSFIVYLTVQNDRPYTISINGIASNNIDEINVLNSIISTIKYENFDSSQLSFKQGLQRVLAAVTGDTLDKEYSNTPFDIDPESVFKVILKNQPSVVRIATIACADIELPAILSQNSTTLKGACVAGTGSGSIVTEDGYIATNGHVVDVPKDYLPAYVGNSMTVEQSQARFNEISEYLVKEGLLSKQAYTNLFKDYDSKKIDGYQLISAFMQLVPKNVKLSNDETKHYAQTSTKAMKLETVNNRLVVKSDSTIKEAKYIGQDFQNNGGVVGLTPDSKGTDVALLKIEGKYPSTKLGSIKSVSNGSEITAIGYPVFVDDGLTTKSDKTKPTITQGKVIEIGTIDSKNLIATSVPISAGNSGGPAFNKDGSQIGLNTYGNIKCPDANCFGDGIVRDIADLTQLAEKNNIKLSETSSISSEWAKGLDAYLLSNFKGAVKSFNTVQKEYPALYLAASMEKLSQSKVGSPGDKSSEFESASNLKIIGLIAGVIVIFSGSTLGFFLLRGSHKKNKQLNAQAQVPGQQAQATTAQVPQPNPSANPNNLPPSPPTNIPPSTPS